MQDVRPPGNPGASYRAYPASKAQVTRLVEREYNPTRAGMLRGAPVIAIYVDAEGNTSGGRILKTSADSIADQAALRVVQAIDFEPAVLEMDNGELCRLPSELYFKLDFERPGHPR